ncbi:MAG: hypothetical protein WC775_00850 [Patescibacteria group bacterium]|jgi:dTMP kinase
MKVVFAQSQDGETTDKDTRTTILQHLKRHKVQVVETIRKKPQSDSAYFIAQKKAIEEADCIIAEVTHPSTDVGGQIVYALTIDKPVLSLIYKENADEITPMLSGNPSENLFLEHYDDKNLKYILENYFDHVTFLSRNIGKLIVIDGGDGSGKATQTELLAKYLDNQKVVHRVYDFPQYYSSFHGAIVGRLLSGEFGTLNTISPYLASLAYALDRASVKTEMRDFLKKGGVIISNRYATSNMGHQAGRIPNPLERQKFLKWVYELEYKIHKIPVEDIVIYLYVPWQIGLELTKQKSARSYTKGMKLDIHESDIQFRINSEEMFLSLCKTKKHWVKIDCIKNGKMLSKEDIHQKILLTLREKHLIP